MQSAFRGKAAKVGSPSVHKLVISGKVHMLKPLCIAAAFVALAYSSQLAAQDEVGRMPASVRSTFAELLKPRPDTHECFLHTLSCNTSKVDEVNIYGCVTSDFYYYNAHLLQGVASGTRIRATISSLFSPLIVVGKSGSADPLAYGASIDYTVTSAGDYVVLVVCSSAVVTSPCGSNANSLCLTNSRFAVTVTWKDHNSPPNSGVGQAVAMTADTGSFWFFQSTNTELVVKVLDGRALNGRYWVFFGSLTDVEFTLTVRDTQTGQVRTYFNSSGRMASVGDTSAF
jgi:hypothetical protein